MKASFRMTLQIIAVIFVLFFFIPVFLPSGYTITVTKKIDAPVNRVFPLVNNLKNRKSWSPFEQDPTLKNHFEGPAAGVGAKRFWAGKKSGKGSMEIIRSVPGKSIDTKMNFGTPGSVTAHWDFSPQKDGFTRVTWKLKITGLKYPFGKWLGLFLRKSIRQILGEGLDALKIISEEKSKIPHTNPQEKK